MLRTELLVKDSEFAESNQVNRSGTADSKHNIVPETLSTVYRLSVQYSMYRLQDRAGLIHP